MGTRWRKMMPPSGPLSKILVSSPQPNLALFQLVSALLKRKASCTVLRFNRVYCKYKCHELPGKDCSVVYCSKNPMVFQSTSFKEYFTTCCLASHTPVYNTIATVAMDSAQPVKSSIALNGHTWNTAIPTLFKVLVYTLSK